MLKRLWLQTTCQETDAAVGVQKYFLLLFGVQLTKGVELRKFFAALPGIHKRQLSCLVM